MKPCLKLTVVSASPIFSLAIERLLTDGPLECAIHAMNGSQLAEPSGTALFDFVVVAPRRWQELASWLHPLRKNLAHLPWLLLAELPLIGMFLSELQSQPCSLVVPSAGPAELWRAIFGLADGQFACLHDELITAFACGAAASWSGTRLRLPSTLELQCGCAVCLGLSNRQIAETLHLRESTVKSHLYRLMQKLEISSRYELSCLFDQALAAPPAAPGPQPFGGKIGVPVAHGR